MLNRLSDSHDEDEAPIASNLDRDRNRLHAERARGEALLTVGPHGIRRLREGGSLKIRLPSGSSQAILINTAGGIAGGDSYAVHVGCEERSRLTVTTQAAERVYRSLGPAAAFSSHHEVAKGAMLAWLPQETILYDGAALHRSIDIAIQEGGRFIGLEATILGRKESGEVVRSIDFRENWRIRLGGRLIHAERFRIDGEPPRTAATLGPAQAFATIIVIAPDAEERLGHILPLLDAASGASAWNGKLVLRLVAPDGFYLRKLLLRLLPVLVSSADLPRLWLL